MKHILEIDSVRMSFKGRMVLSGVYLKVETGSVASILGRNGSGKSTLMNIVFGLLAPEYKCVRIDDVWRQRLNPSEMRYLPQYCFIPKQIRVKEAFSDFDVSFDGFLEYFPECVSLENSQIKNVSTGERRIIECYLILKSKSMFAMLDEPFSMIMPVHVEKVVKMIQSEKAHKGIIITDHRYRDVISVSDSMYVLDSGTLFKADSDSDLIRHGYLSGTN